MNSRDLLAISRARALVASGEARRIREAAHLTQDEIGKTIGASKVTVSSYETGRRVPVSRIALRYARVLDELSRIAS
jgi:DNA-binding XRE family transcriptional regulator